MALKGTRVVFAGREHSPTGIIESEEPEDNKVLVYWGRHDNTNVRSWHDWRDLDLAPLLTEAPDLVPGVDPSLIIKED